MIVLGLDPGPRRSGWALLERDPAKPPRWIDGGWHPIEEVLGVQLRRASLVAVEWLARGLFERVRHDALVETARVEGGVEWYLRKVGVKYTKLTAGQWRGDVVGNASASTPEISAALRLRVRGIPSPPVLTAESLEHSLDALGVALAASCAPGEQLRLLAGRGRR